MKKELSALKPLFILLPLLVLGFVLFWTLFGEHCRRIFSSNPLPLNSSPRRKFRARRMLRSAVSSTVFPAAR